MFLGGGFMRIAFLYVGGGEYVRASYLGDGEDFRVRVRYELNLERPLR